VKFDPSLDQVKDRKLREGLVDEIIRELGDSGYG
jgi:hypothetical protein